MKSYSIVATALVTVVFGGPLVPRGIAQQTGLGAASPGDVPKAQATYLLAEFSRSLNGKKLKPGTVVRAEVSQDVLVHGKIIVPADSRVLGHVTEVKSRGSDPTSRLGIMFDKIVLKHHEERNLQGVVYALAPPAERRSKVDEPDEMLAPEFMGAATQAQIPNRNASPSHRSTTILPPPVKSMPVTSVDPGLMNPRPKASNSRLVPPISLGLAPGAYGIKGLSLSTGASSVTPGPVILSTGKDVKLDYGTQVIIKVMDASMLQR